MIERLTKTDGSPNKRRTILAVDDKESIRGVIRDILKPEHDVIEALDGEEAISILTQRTVDLVILDIDMPITNGWETLHIIHDEKNGWPDLKVMMLTIYKEPESVVKAWILGSTYYLPKPFSPQQLKETVRRALEEHAMNLGAEYQKFKDYDLVEGEDLGQPT